MTHHIASHLSRISICFISSLYDVISHIVSHPITSRHTHHITSHHTTLFSSIQGGSAGHMRMAEMSEAFKIHEENAMVSTYVLRYTALRCTVPY